MEKMIDNSISIEDLITEYNSGVKNIEDYFGHIYLTYCEPEDLYYLGKKVYNFTRKKKLTKKELAELPKTRGRQATTKIVTSPSDWTTYYGSHPTIKVWLKKYDHDKISRNIIKLCKNKKELTYYENKYLYSLGVIEPGSKFINDNISGTIFTRDLQ